MRIGRRATTGAALAALGLALAIAVAEARNPHCSGGILYVTQGMRDKDKGNVDDYERQMRKAVAELTKCAEQDPKDFEAIGYLGWALAEVDSAERAGQAFATAIRGLQEKGDRRKADLVTNNRNSYWARAFNEGVENIRVAQEAYPEFTKKPEGEADQTLYEEAARRYQIALVALIRASLLRPGDPQTIRNLGSVHAFMGDFLQAAAVFGAGLEAMPGDTTLKEARRAARINHGNALINERRFDEAIAHFQEMSRSDPGDAANFIALGDTYFRRAQAREGEARRADFRAAGEAYVQAAKLRAHDPDLPFNAALAYQNATAWELAEIQWRAALQQRPDDVDALSSLGMTLAEQGKYEPAIRTLHQAVTLRPDNKILHRQFGAIYTKAGNTTKDTEELMVFLALDRGQAVSDPAPAAQAAPAGSAAARTLASEGAPEKIMRWEADNERYETWFYWSKKTAYHFRAGALVVKSDWSVADTRVAGAKR